MRALRRVRDSVHYSGTLSTIGTHPSTECICGLAAAVTDLLQSVELEYHGYDGDTKEDDDKKGATPEEVTNHLNGLFSLVQGLGGTSVVRTYIDQLAQVLSALVGWSKIEKCWGNGGSGCDGKGGNGNPHGGKGCAYLQNVDLNTPCTDCGCMKWDVPEAGQEDKGHHLGRNCQRCSSGSTGCQCDSSKCTSPDKCECAKEGKCCKCCCKSACGCKKECSCIKEKKKNGTNGLERHIHKDTYQSAYSSHPYGEHFEKYGMAATWNALHRYSGKYVTIKDSSTARRHQCARILLGSVCLIWSTITYMHWTGKWTGSSPYWNNHILDGSGLDDGTLSQWLQALGFPRDMLNNSGPQNRLDKVIWDGFMGKLFLGFTHPSGIGAKDGTTAKQPYDMNYAGFVHTAHRDSFYNKARVFPQNGTNGHISETDQDKNGALFKLYILSCAYFTGLQKRIALTSATLSTTANTPKTIREILYWLSALPYSEAYKEMLIYAKGRLEKVLKKPGEAGSGNDQKELKFYQENRPHPITVHEYNLFAHFQAVTQYCPLVLIGIQGGLHSTKGTTSPAIHALYANTECHFTYPAVDIQAYNQVVHYIRGLFYQLFFLRKQCAVTVTCGGKWRECRYGDGVLGKDVVSWMCLGCDPMEHDRKSRVDELKKTLDGVVQKVEKEWKGNKDVIEKLRDILVSIGVVVVQLGNAQERLDTGKNDLDGVKEALRKVYSGGNGGSDLKGVLGEVLKVVEEKVKELENVNGLKELEGAVKKAKDALTAAKNVVGKQNGDGVDPCKNLVRATIDGIHKVLEILNDWWNKINANGCRQNIKEAILNAFENMEDVCNTSKCPSCRSHSTKCGRQGEKKTCPTCHQQYMEGTPSPLQAFLEDRLPGFSCNEVLNTEDTDDYPPAASHLGHCGGSGQCCPLPMGFRNNFQDGVTHTGKRLYGILYFFSNGDMMQSCVYTLVRVTAALSATTPQVLGDVFGFFRGGVGNKEKGKTKKDTDATCKHDKDPSNKGDEDYFCGWCASGLRDVVKDIQWIPKEDPTAPYRDKVGTALINIKGDKGASPAPQSTTNNLSTLTDVNHYVSPLTGELYTAVSATFGRTYLSWVLYLSDALEGGLQSLSEAFLNIECRGCRECDPNKCKKGEHGQGSGQCGCQSIVSCTGVLPVLYRHGFSYGNPFNLEGYQQRDEKNGDYSIENKHNPRRCHEFLESLIAVIKKKEDASKAASTDHPLTNLLSQVGQLQYDIRLPWIFVLTLAWLVAVLYLAFGAIWPLDWTHMRSHWLRGGAHQWQCMWYKVMTGTKVRVALEGVASHIIMT